MKRVLFVVTVLAFVTSLLAAEESKIEIATATYGIECGTNQSGNSTSFVSAECDNKEQCTYTNPGAKIGDHCPGTPKSFTVQYTCSGKNGVRTKTAQAEAEHAVIQITCKD